MFDYLSKIKHCGSTPSENHFIQESAPFKLNWALCMLWAGIRSDWWTKQSWKDNNDVADLGGVYQTFRESTRACCTEFDKYVDTSMMPEQELLEKEYELLVEYALGKNPKAEDPVVTPPKPPTPPIPEPEKPPAPTPTNWKKVLGIIIGVLSVAAIAAKMFLPGSVNVVIDIVLKLLNTIAGG
jgi:hypothetical protein